jgi:hypothetical protein
MTHANHGDWLECLFADIADRKLGGVAEALAKKYISMLKVQGKKIVRHTCRSGGGACLRCCRRAGGGGTCRRCCSAVRLALAFPTLPSKSSHVRYRCLRRRNKRADR